MSDLFTTSKNQENFTNSKTTPTRTDKAPPCLISNSKQNPTFTNTKHFSHKNLNTMAIYKCLACGHEYNEETEGVKWTDLDDDWTCPLCGTDKSMFEPIGGQETSDTDTSETTNKEETLDTYLQEWVKKGEAENNYLAEIHQISKTGASIHEPMKTSKPVVSWDDIIIKGAQLAKIPLNAEEAVSTKTIIGPNAKTPLVLDTPITISHMSFGAISREFKIAMAKGSAGAKTAICSGEGGILDDELASSHKFIFEYVPNRYSVTDEYLKKVDAVEIKIGQAAKPGMGGHLPGDKVTQEIAEIRDKEVGKDILSPSSYDDIRTADQLKEKVDWLREKTEGKPIGVKIAAGNIENDLALIIQANADFITIDGRGGATGSAPKFIKDNSSVPTLFALHRAKAYLEQKGRKDISIIITGGLRISPDFAKAIALGATAVAIATAAMIAGGCQQYKICNSGMCPVGIATQDPKLRERLNIDLSAQRIENYLNVSTAELKTFARITGNNGIHQLTVKDLCTGNSEISNHTNISHF